MTDSNTRLLSTPSGHLAVEVRFRVRYFETDAMGIVHHAAYITWFEEGRSAFTRALGYPYSRMEKEGVSLAVAEVTARYHRPARYDDEVLVTAVLIQLGSRGMSFSYEVRRVEDGELLVTGASKHISVDTQGRVTLLPRALRVALAG
jgi:acyl-CoA thioester hydrolase